MAADVVNAACTDRRILDEWHPVGAVAELGPGDCEHTLLLGEPIRVVRAVDGGLLAHGEGPADTALPLRVDFGYVWVCLGSPPERLFALPEYEEPDRRNLNAASIVVATSAPRAVENFLDLAHFPFVHPGSLGVLPHTEVVDYEVEIIDGEIMATECDFFVPIAAPNADEPALIRYRYRVPHPYCALLYYGAVDSPDREDVVGLFMQPMTDELIRAHNYLGFIDRSSSDNAIRDYQQGIFAQDKPILENQHPKRLPLDPRAETPIRADRSAIVYRRWLGDLGVTYGVITAES